MKYFFNWILPFLFLLLVSVLFFYQFFFFGKIPFPGDLLANASPFKVESFLGYAAVGYSTKFQYADVMHETYPWKLFAIRSLKNGIILFCNPHNFSGTLHIQ